MAAQRVRGRLLIESDLGIHHMMGIEDEPKIGQESWTTPDDIEILIVSAANISKVTIVSTGDRQVCLYLNCKSECLKRGQNLQKVNPYDRHSSSDKSDRNEALSQPQNGISAFSERPVGPSTHYCIVRSRPVELSPEQAGFELVQGLRHFQRKSLTLQDACK